MPRDSRTKYQDRMEPTPSQIGIKGPKTKIGGHLKG